MSTLIVYASQTGTAEEVAKELKIDLLKINIQALICSASLIALQDLRNLAKEQAFIIFMISTTGEGQPPDSLVSLWQSMLDSSLEATFIGMKYSIFGFGDSKYGDLFNAMARKFDRRLKMLGAIDTIQRGLGDEQDQPTGYRVAYEPWKQLLFTYLQSNELKVINWQKSKKVKKTTTIRVKTVEILANIPERTTFKVKFESDLQYNPGDILNLYPQNKQPDIDYFIKYFNLTGQQILKHADLQPMPSKILFSNHINLSDTVPFAFFKNLAQGHVEQIVKDKLTQLGTDYQQYMEYIKTYRRNLKEFIDDFPDVFISLEHLLSNLNLLRPRQYSITSKFDGKEITLLVRLLEKQITPYRMIKGIISSEMFEAKEGHQMEAFVSSGKCHNWDQYILVGIGTGIAPILSIVRQNCMVYFGNKTHQQLYEYEYFKNMADKKLIHFRTATSKQQNIHVQDLLVEDTEKICQFVNGKTCLFVCGTNHSFTTAVSQMVVQQILKEKVKDWKKQKRLICQFW